jgi:hypothetical protein
MTGVEGPGDGREQDPRPFPRTRSARLAATYLLLGVAVWLALATVGSLYRGTGVAKAQNPPEHPVTGQVTGCHRVGPVSLDGFGLWWHCHLTVRTGDGRVVDTEVGHSVVIPAGAGHPVDLREACAGADNTRCRYGRPTSLFWGVSLKILGYLEYAVILAFGFIVAGYLLGAVIGVDRFDRMIRRGQKA